MLVSHNAFLQRDLVFEMVAHLQVMMHLSCNAQYIYMYIIVVIIIIIFFFFAMQLFGMPLATFLLLTLNTLFFFFFCLLPAYSCFFFSYVYPANFTYPNN